MKLFKYNNPETYADELAPLSKELCLLKNGNKYTFAIKNEVDILSSGSYIPLDPETNLDYQRRYYDFVPIYPNYSCRVENGVDKDFCVVKTYLRLNIGYSYFLYYIEEKLEIDTEQNYAITLGKSIKELVRKAYILQHLGEYFGDLELSLKDPNQESEPERIDAIYKP